MAPQFAPAQVTSIVEQRYFDDAKVTFPLVLTPGPDASFGSALDVRTWLEQNNLALLEAGQNHGAILFRGFPLKNAEDFNVFVNSWGLEEFPYVGGAAPRSQVTGSVFTANESPADQLIPYHHELAQSKNFPSKLFFFCDLAAEQGGETPICLSNRVYEQIKSEFPNFIEEISQKGVKYIRTLSAEDDQTSAIGRGWKSTFLTQDAKIAEEKAKELGMTFEWLPNDSLKTISPVLSATRVDPRTGKVSWFNSIVAAFTGWKDTRNDPTKAVVYGDGTPLDPDVLTRCLAIMDELSVAFVWEKGDVLLVDNLVTMHARRSYVGQRKIYASLWK